MIWFASRSNLFLKELMLRYAKTARFKFLIRISLRLLKLTSSELTSESSEIHSTSFILEQFEPVQLFQKLDLKNFKTIFAKIELPFLFKCNFFWPKCSSFKLTLSIRSIFFWFNNFLNMSLPVKLFCRYFYDLSGLLWESFLTCLTILFTWFSMFVPLAKSFVPAWTIRQSGLLFTNWSMFSKIVALVPPGKLFTFTL